MATLQRLFVRGTPRATKQAARYTPAGGAERCGMCRHYAAPSSCARIEGPVSAAGWCMLFSRQVTYPHHAGVQSSSSAGQPPSLDLGFLSPGVLDPQITFTRASTGTYVDIAGVMQTAAINAPRWDYDPVTHQLKGVLIEEQRTNVLLNSAALTTQSATVTALPWTLSFYGTGTITRSGVSTGATTGTGASARTVVTFTPTAGSLTLTVTGSVTNAQLESGGYATSYIATAGSPVVRSRDICTTPVGAWYDGTKGSLAVEYIFIGCNNNFNSPVQLVGSNVNTDYINTEGYVAPTAGVPNVQVMASAFVANVASGTATIAAMPTPLGVVHKGAGAWTLNGGLQGAHDGIVSALAAVGALPAVLNLTVGGPMHSQQQQNLWARRVRYWPRAMGASELQSVTS